MHCQSCNERLPLSARACFACGAPVHREGSASVPREGAMPAPPPPGPEPEFPVPGRTTEAVSLRDRPYSSARQIAAVPVGEAVTVTDARWGFLLIELNDGRRGYVEPGAISVASLAAGTPQHVAMFPAPTREPAYDLSRRPATMDETPPARPEGRTDASPLLPARQTHDDPSPFALLSGEADSALAATTEIPVPSGRVGRRRTPSAPLVETEAEATPEQTPPRARATTAALAPDVPAHSSAPAPPPAPAPKRPTIRAIVPADLRPPEPAGEPPHALPASPAEEPRRATKTRRAATVVARVQEEPLEGDLPFNIPFLEGEHLRFRAVFLYNPDDERALVVTNRRLIVTGGTVGKLPRVLHLDEVEAVRLQDSGTGSSAGEGNLHITITGMRGTLLVGGVYMAHHARNEILAACTDLSRASRAALRRKTS